MTYSAQRAAQHGFGTGDRVVVPKSGFNIIAHHAMFYGHGHNGEALVAENKEGRGVILRPRCSHAPAPLATGKRFSRTAVTLPHLAQQETCAVGSGRELLWQVGRSEHGQLVGGSGAAFFSEDEEGCVAGFHYRGLRIQPKVPPDRSAFAWALKHGPSRMTNFGIDGLLT